MKWIAGLMMVVAIAVLMLTLLVPGEAYAQNSTKTLSPDFFEQRGYEFPVSLDCNWDGQISSVTVFGYYGEDGAFQAIVEPTNLAKIGRYDVLLNLGGDAFLTHATGGKLHHLDIEFRTRGRCPEGFSPGMLTR